MNILEKHISETWNSKAEGEKKKATKKKTDEPVPFSETIEAVSSNTISTKTPVHQTTIKRVCPTRWSSRHDAVKCLRHNYKDILKALTQINLTSKKSDERAEAAGLVKAIQNFDFVLLIDAEDYSS